MNCFVPEVLGRVEKDIGPKHQQTYQVTQTQNYLWCFVVAVLEAEVEGGGGFLDEEEEGCAEQELGFIDEPIRNASHFLGTAAFAQRFE